MSNPLCPVTGEPAVRLVQWIKRKHLLDLWKYTFRLDLRRDFEGIERFGLWESPTGLYFFDPTIEGSHEFYSTFYESLRQGRMVRWTSDMTRQEFHVAARHVSPGDRVLDVGCGFANFRHAVPHARYTGLDPHFAEGSAIEGVLNQSLAGHLADHAGSYDVACAFQVLEHLSSPVGMFADMVRIVRPGGLVVVGVPHHPSAISRLPNCVFNAPPHHLTWWTTSALTELAERNGASVVSIEEAAWGKEDALLYWMDRYSPIHCVDVHFKSVWSWHLAALIGYCAGQIAHRVRAAPTAAADGIGLVMVARRRD